MLIQLGPLVANASGSIGGTTIQKTGSGLTARKKPTGDPPPDKPTVMDSINRLIFFAADRGWSHLGLGDRKDWSDFAAGLTFTNRFGDPYTPTGYLAYLKCRTTAYHGPGGSYVIPYDQPWAAPEAPWLPSGLTVELTGGGSQLLVNFGNGPLPANRSILLSASPPLPSGLSYAGNRVRQVARLIPTTSTGVDIAGEYVERYGALPPPNSNVLIRWVVWDTKSGWPYPEQFTRVVTT